MDIKFVKEIRQKHCKGCLNNSISGNKHLCNNQSVIDCWLRKTYLPKGVYAEACEADAISMDIKFVKEIRQKHCKGCQNNSNCGSKYLCDNKTVIDCWLRKTYLPEGVYAEACEADAISHMTNHIEKVINKKIVDIIRNKRNK